VPVGVRLGHMVLEYVIIGLICLQIVLGFIQTKLLADLQVKTTMELIEELPEGIGEALSQIPQQLAGSDFNPVQMALAELIGGWAKNQSNTVTATVLKGDDGKFIKDNS